MVCLKQLKIVGDGYAVGIVDNAQKLRNQSQTVAGFLANLQKAQLDVRQQWGDYRATYLTPEEKRLADQAEAAMANANRSVDKLRQIVQSGDAAALQHYVDREMYPRWTRSRSASPRWSTCSCGWPPRNSPNRSSARPSATPPTSR